MRAVTARHLRRWLVGAVLVVAFASIGLGRDLSESSLLRDAGAAAGVPSASAVQSPDAVVPIRAAKLSVAERAAVKLPGLNVIMAAAAAAVAAVPRLRLRRTRGSERSPALRRRVVPRRGPPAFSLA
jgi:hypothetical protein